MAEGDKNKTLYAILGIIPLTAELGIHKFYVGDVKNGVIMLLVSLCGFGIGAIIMWICGLMSGIKALKMSDKEFEQTYVIDKKFM